MDIQDYVGMTILINLVGKYCVNITDNIGSIFYVNFDLRDMKTNTFRLHTIHEKMKLKHNFSS